MSDDIQREEDAIRYVLGEMSRDEEIQFEAQLAIDPELEALVAANSDLLAIVGDSGPRVKPPKALKSRIENSVMGPAQKNYTIPLLIAGLVLLLGGYLISRQFFKIQESALIAKYDGVNDIAERMRAERDSLALQVEEANQLKSEIEAERDSVKQELAAALNAASTANLRVVSLTPAADASMDASLAWNEKVQQGLLEVGKLPPSEPGKSYQLWLIDENNPQPVSAGVFEVAADGTMRIPFEPDAQVKKAVAFAISVEASGGSKAPQGPIIMQNGM